jgi:hypothetical protein
METFECTLCRLAVTAEQVLQFPELLSSAPRKKKPRLPSVEMSGPKFTSVAVWGTMPQRPGSVRRIRISPRFDISRCVGQHKRGASKTAKPSALRGRQRLCLRPVPLQVEPAEQVVPIISLPGRSVRPKKHIPVGPQLKQPSGLGFRTNCNNVADLVAHGERRWRLQAVMECHSRHPHYGGGSDQH